MDPGMVLLCVFMMVLLTGAGLVIKVMTMAAEVKKLKRQVEQLEQQSLGFYPASYQYLSDLNELIAKKGR